MIDLSQLQTPKRKHSCKVATIAKELDEKNTQKLHELVEDPNYPAKTLARQLTQLGLEISDSPINAHRKRACSCWKI